jgi:hypothetical protein
MWFSKRRIAGILCLVVVSAIGIASRVLYTGSIFIDKYLGDVVYAAVFYLFLGIVWDRGRARSKALFTLLFVLAVEVFQLTLIPLRFSESDSYFLRFASILLGTQFAWLDLVAYSVGIAGVYLLDERWLRRLE